MPGLNAENLRGKYTIKDFDLAKMLGQQEARAKIYQASRSVARQEPGDAELYGDDILANPHVNKVAAAVPGIYLSFKDTQHLENIKREYNLTDLSQLNLEKALRMAAANNKLKDVVLLIVRLNVNVNAVDANANSKKTALHHAASKGHDQIVKYLLQKQADTTVKDASGNTPFMLAKENTEAYRLLAAKEPAEFREVNRMK